jgi:hypothetical protein
MNMLLESLDLHAMPGTILPGQANHAHGYLRRLTRLLVADEKRVPARMERHVHANSGLLRATGTLSLKTTCVGAEHLTRPDLVASLVRVPAPLLDGEGRGPFHHFIGTVGTPLEAPNFFHILASLEIGSPEDFAREYVHYAKPLTEDHMHGLQQRVGRL